MPQTKDGIYFPKGGGPAPSYERLLGNVNNIYTLRNKQTLSAGDTRINTTTFNQLFQCPVGAFQAVRPLYGNIEASGTFTVKSIVGCPADFGVGGVSSSKKWTTASANTTITNDGATGWQAVLFGGAAAGTVPAKGTDTSQPGLLAADMTPCQSVAPTNGATRPAVIVRTIVPTSGGTGFTNLNHSTDANVQIFDKQIYNETYIWTGDGVSSSPASFSGGSNQAVGPCIGVEFLVDKVIHRVLCVGDSITQGVETGATLAHNSWVNKAGDLLVASGIPANLINCGWSGATTTQIAAFAKLAMTFHKPNILFYPPFSPNDGTPTQAIVDTQYRRAMDVANFALANNILPVFTFLAPNDAYSAAADAFRQSLKARCNASGFMVADISSAIVATPGAAPERYGASLSSDTTHPSAAGYSLMAPVAQSIVTEIVQSNSSY